MKAAQILVSLAIGFVIGGFLGSKIARERARVAILSSPLSDNLGPALSAILEAKGKLLTGNTNVFEQLQAAETQIRSAQDWSKKFLGSEKDDTQ